MLTRKDYPFIFGPEQYISTGRPLNKPYSTRQRFGN